MHNNSDGATPFANANGISDNQDHAETSALRRLQTVSALLIQKNDAAEIYRHILQAAVDLMKADCASVQLLDPQNDKLKLLGSIGFHLESEEYWQWVDAGSASSCGAALQNNERVLIADIENCRSMDGSGDLDAYQKSDIRAVQSTPLRSRSGKPIGMISTHWHQPHVADERSLRYFDLLARQAADVVERLQFLEQLGESEERLRALTDQLPGGIVYQIATDANGQGRRFLFVSQRYEEFTGVPVSALLEDANIAYSVLFEDDLATLAAAEADSIAGKGPLDIEVRYRHVSGQLRWARIISARRVQPDGSMIWDGIQIDISEQKQALDALRASEARFRDVLENMGEAFALLDRDLRIIDMNAEALRLEEREASEIVGRTHWQAHPNAAPAIGELYLKAIAEQIPVSLQHRYVWPDGRDSWLNMRAYPVGDNLAVFYRDITVTKRAEIRRLALAELGERFLDMANPDDIAFAAAETLGRALDVSRAGYGTIDKAAETITIARDWNAPGTQSLAGVLQFRDYGSYIDDLKNGVTVAIADARLDERTKDSAPALEAISSRAFVNMPVTEQGGTVALLYLNHESQRIWSDDDLVFIREVAVRTRNAVERRRTEAALRDNEIQLRQISDALPVLVSHVDSNMVYRYANRAYETWFEKDTSEIIGKDLVEVVGEQAFEALRPYIMRAIDGEQMSFESQVEYQRAGTRDVRVDVIPVSPENGGGYYALVQDIGEAKRTEAALRESENRFRQIADSAPVPMWVTQIDRTRSFVNKAYLDFLGVDYDTALTFDWRTILHPDDHDRVVAESVAGEASLEPFALEARYRAGDGEWHWIRSQSQPRWGANNMHVGFIGVAHDISEAKNAEIALRESEARFRFLDRLAEATQNEDEPEAVMAAATRLLGEHLGVDICAYADVEADSDAFHIRRDWTSETAASIVGSYSLDDFGPVAAAAQRGGTALIVNDALVELGEDQAFTGIGVAATICLPLVKQGRLAAMMAVHSASPRDWTSNEVSLVREVAERCWAHVERVGANAVLRASEQRFREQFENANDFIFTTDLEMRITSCNPAVAAALERTPEELIGHRISDYTPPETWERNKSMLAAKLGGQGDATRYEVEVFDPHGERMMWEINSRLVRDTKGAPLGLHAIGRDVSEQIRNQRTIEEARQRAEKDAAEQSAILGQLAEGVILTDAAGKISFVNDAATKLHGVAALDIVPSKYSQVYNLFREDGSPYAFEELPLARAVRNGETVRDARWRIRRPDGTEVLVIGNAQPVIGPDGITIGAVLTIRDDTARSAAERALLELNETLEERVAQRTVELEQAQEALRQSQKLEAMGQLTGGVAHDFNNLLTPIMGSLDLLHRRRLGDEREQRLIEGALQSAERAKLLVQRLLAFARRQPLKAVAVDVRQLVSGMADLVSSTCGPNIKVHVSVEDDIPSALADPNQLEMAILNLSVNARDAMPDGGRLTLSATRELVESSGHKQLSPGGYVRLSIADTGSGMDETTAQRAVEPFFSTKGIGKGTGLGLSMAHGLASQLGGVLTLSSAPGLGTNVEIWLPASEQEAASAQATEPNNMPDAKAGRILLVDDELLVRASTSHMLTDLGFEVSEASTAEEALTIFDADDRFDMLVTDHLMPGMTGVDLAHAIRNRQPGMPVLIVSGYAETEGVPAYLPRLTKPFRQSDLANALTELGEQKVPAR